MAAPSVPSKDWKEVIPADEAARFEGYAVQLRDLARARARGGKASRALHAKGNAGLEGELTVLPDLPAHARVGLFAEPRSYPTWVRFSNGVGARQSDKKGDVRGVALKIVGVDGKKVIPGLEDARTQDFLMIQSSAQPFSNADDFVWLVTAAARPLTLLPRLFGHFGLGAGFRLLRKFLGAINRPVSSLATSSYYSALPTRFGDYAVRYALLPRATAPAGAKQGSGADYLGEELSARLAKAPVVYDLKVQFFVDEVRTPIEDGSVDWAESDSPYLQVATLTLPVQDTKSARGVAIAEFIEGLSFDPWHAQEVLRPLGNLMRARNAAYRLSTRERGAAPEPDGSERFG